MNKSRKIILETFENVDDTPGNLYIHVVDGKRPSVMDDVTAHSNIQSSTDKCVFRYRQSSVRRLLPASDCCRACGNQIVEHSSDNETVLGSSRKLGGAAEHLIDRVAKDAFVG